MKTTDRQTSLTVTGSYAIVNPVAPGDDEPPGQQPYNRLLCDYSSLMQLTGALPAATTKVTHHIETARTPNFIWPCRLAPYKHHLVNTEPDPKAYTQSQTRFREYERVPGGCSSFKPVGAARLGPPAHCFLMVLAIMARGMTL